MSKHTVADGDLSGLFERFGLLQEKALARTGRDYEGLPGKINLIPFNS